MAWRYIEHPVVPLDVLDVDAINANLDNFAEEVNGGLNEHNFSEDALLALQDQWADDIGLRLTHDYTEVNPALTTTDGTPINQSTQWLKVGTLTRQFASRGATFLVVASFQVSNLASVDLSAIKQSGLQFAIEIDGAVMYESLLGSGDMTNDYVEPANLWGAVLTGTSGTGPAIRQYRSSIVLEHQGYIEPGLHRVRVVARNLNVVNDATLQASGQEELGIVEMHG